jgi:hypothetical protein
MYRNRNDIDKNFEIVCSLNICAVSVFRLVDFSNKWERNLLEPKLRLFFTQLREHQNSAFLYNLVTVQQFDC